MERRIKIIAACILGAIAIYLIVTNIVSKPTVVINGQTFNVELANTTEKQQQGLSGRESLKNNEGMLFIFDQPGQYQFWMKEMKFPIDILWINGYEIVYIVQNAPIPAGDNIPTFSPDVSADKVLEINAGWVKKLGIKIGDKVNITNL